jgi:DNA invertase Pin-like site-specific DNA recombinase
MFAIYVRVSEVGDREGESFGSPDEQEAAARGWAERAGVEVEDDPTIELDVSGRRDASERELGRLIERCEAEELEGIIFYDLDRFSRDRLSGGMMLRRLRECQARAVFVRQGIDTGAKANGQNLVLNILLDVADDQWERLAEARRRGKQRAAERGLHLAARCPTGYRWADRQKGGRTPIEGGGIGRLEEDPMMGPKVKEAFRRRANGESYEKLASFLGLAGKSSARAIIQNRVYVGEATVPTERKGVMRVIEKAHRPLVTQEEWERANAVGGSYAPRSGRWSALARLNGIARCAGCGKPLAVGSMGGRQPYYACTAEGCTQRTGIRAGVLDEYVGGLVTQAVLDEVPEVIAILAGDDRYQRALDAVGQARAELDTYRAEIKVSDVGAEAWKRDVAARKVALDLARAELRATPAVGQEAYSKEIPVTAEQWAAADTEQRSAIIEAAMDRDRLARLVDRVLIKPCGRGKRVPVGERAEIWFVGAAEAWDAPEAEQTVTDEQMAALRASVGTEGEQVA